MTLTVMRKSFKKLKPRVNYRSYKHLPNEVFRENLSISIMIMGLKSFVICNITLKTLDKYAPRKAKLEAIRCL